MKNFYVTIISVFLTTFFAQAQTFLNQAETTSRIVQDPYALLLSPGFNAKATVVNPFVAKIGPSTTTPPISPNNSTAGVSNPSGETISTLNGSIFHDTKGDIAVGSSGQLQYSLPIALPPGINSVAPQMNLMYTSGSGNGIAGFGWSLSGITNIARTGKNIEKDGVLKGIDLTLNDYYVFNGNRLLLKSGEYGKNGAEYVTEKFSNLKIKSIGDITNANYQGPESWEVTFEDGSQAWFGTNVASRTPLEYNITKWKDAQGNYITYNYTQTDNVVAISTIQWGGNETLSKSHFNSIDFEYIARNLKEIAYSNGLAFTQNNLLKNIVVKANNSLFKKYVIDYKNDPNTSIYQYVDKITEHNSQSQAANPVVFNYEQSSNSIWSESNFTDNDEQKIVGDFDGDGTLDYLKYYNDYNDCKAYHTATRTITDEEGNSTEVSELVCTSTGQSPAGIYLLSSFFDEGSVKKQYLSFPTFQFTADDFKNAKVTKFIDNDNKISTRDGILIKKEAHGALGLDDIVFETFAVENGMLKLITSKTIPGNLYDKYKSIINEHECPEECLYYDPNAGGVFYSLDLESIHTTFWNPNSWNIRDIDGDGICEAILNCTYYSAYYYGITDPNFINLPEPEYSRGYFFGMIVNLDPKKNIEDSLTKFSENESAPISNIEVDFNGDGKTEQLFFYDPRNYNSNQLTLAEYSKDSNNKYVVTYKYINTTIKGLKYKSITGDFNGDGKTDLMVPFAEGSKDWNMYISNGKDFIEYAYPNFSYYKPDNYFEDSGRVYYYNRQYLAQDLNLDGKSDFIEFSSHSRQNRHTENNFSQFIINTYKNKGFDSGTGKYVMEKKNIDGHAEGQFSYPLFNNTKEYKSYPFSYIDSGFIYLSTPLNNSSYSTPHKIEPFSIIVGNFNINNSNSQIIVQKKGLVKTFNYAKVGAKVNSISQGGINTDIVYSELDPKVNPGFYAPVKEEQYPYVESDKLSQMFAVSQLKQNGKQQDFKYRGFVSHMTGKAMLGYRQTARSSWYAPNFNATKIWSASEIDPLNESVPIKEWSTLDENNIFPTDVTENTAGLLSFKKTAYETTIIPTTINPNVKVEARVVKSTLQKDFLTQITTTTTINKYDKFFLPEESTIYTNNGVGIKTTKIRYESDTTAVGRNYFVGRIIEKEEIVTAYNDTKKSKQLYTYENNLLKTSKTYNNDYSGYILETIDLYDGFGNILEKTTTNSVDAQSQKEKNAYDDKGRFVTKKTDNLGLEVNMTYNDWGQVLTQIDPLGNTVTNTYDGWGKLLTSGDNLSGYVTYKYEKQNFVTTVTKYLPDGDIESTVTNGKGETILTRTKAFNSNQYIEKAVTYDILGRKTAESEPYLSSETPKWNTIAYDESVFPPKGTATAFNGKKVETKVEGRTTIMTELNGYNRVTKKTTDALGNVVESEDKGGIITFTYNAASQNLTATYGQNVVTTTYDNWGRKASFHDPSNGMYSYTYHGFGQLKKVTSPKGYKEFLYNNKGQLETQIEKSNDVTSTDKSVTFTYDNKGRITNRQGTSNGKAYSSYITYDAQGRSIASGESSNNRYYLKKNVIYDDKGRVTSYEKGMYSGGTYTKATIENVYAPWSGDLYQVKDKTTQKVLWQLNTAKANGQVLTAKLGEVNVTNAYDSNNFLQSVSHVKAGATPVTVLGLGYSFDAIKNELKWRTRTNFAIATESFFYDGNNRLLNWTNPKTGYMSNNVYDDQGRITNNDQLGEVKFKNAESVYRASSIEPNTNLTNHWPDRETILQKITYNENNDPIYLDGKNGDYAFEYGLNESRQVMHYGGNFDPALTSQQAKFSKYYSEDGSYEVIRDNTTGQEKHLMYIGGSPYESDIVLLKNFAEITAKYVFLHKDYLGTILAITSDTGAILEQRHFNAWGVFTHLEQNGVLTPLPLGGAGGGLLIDRGYTSHEHLQDVGIIHMNGRLYDPLLRRFLNADENIQDPYNTQCYNKYGYVINNPLMFNDPSGEIAFLAFFALPLVKAILIGAAVALVSYTVGLAVTGNLWRWTVGGALKSMFWGAVSGAVTFGIGNMFSVVKEGTQGVMEATKLATALGGTGSTGVIIVQGACHAVAQGTLSLVQGGKFWSGATAGFLGHLGAEAWGASMRGLGLDEFAKNTGGIVTFGALSGGVGAELTGGNFWQGAVTGGIVAGLNTALHNGFDRNDPPNKYKKWFSDRLKDAELLTDLYNHYQWGGRENFYYDVSNLQLNGATQRSLGLAGKMKDEVSLFKYGTPAQALAFGRLEFVRVGNSNQFTVTKNKFDFDYQPKQSFSRNANTFIGAAIFGNFYESHYVLPQPNTYFGGPFEVIFRGKITIPK